MERFATGAWLDRAVLRLAAAAMLAATIAGVTFGFAIRTGPFGTLDLWGRPLGTDFTLIWSAGRMALEGKAAAIYDWTLLAEAERATHGTSDGPFFGWHYPPLFVLVAAALAPMSYLMSLVVWQATTLAAAVAVAWRILPGRDTLLAALGFPAVFVCLAHGHNAFLTAALFGAGCSCSNGAHSRRGCSSAASPTSRISESFCPWRLRPGVTGVRSSGRHSRSRCSAS
jgi:hypothetical protein